MTLAELLAKTAMAESHNVRVGEIHGMAQRGGHVMCTVRIGLGVRGPIIDAGTADVLVGFEPIETLRELHLLREGGHVIMNTHVVCPVAVSMGTVEYPPQDVVLSKLHARTSSVIHFDATEIAQQAGSTASLNIVMMGAIIASGVVPVRRDTALDTITSSFPSRFRSVNEAAFSSGFEMARRALST
ncbi:MAG: indolepyruvate oxidoreductase subunit beta [Candidatus Thorarchaeota archaeon]|nr:indolepyruvate oxidoreductase subunit beta [Candidatus Thorarchaeota archaeon]